MKTNEEVWSIVNELKALYPNSLCSLEYEKDYELLFSVRLAAQCTDERVNKVTPALFARFPTLESLAEADVAEVEQYIHSTGFFRAKPGTSSWPPRCSWRSTGAGSPAPWRSF